MEIRKVQETKEELPELARTIARNGWLVFGSYRKSEFPNHAFLARLCNSRKLRCAGVNKAVSQSRPAKYRTRSTIF